MAFCLESVTRIIVAIALFMKSVMVMLQERRSVMDGSDKIKAALKRIEEGLETINTNEDWLKYLVFQSRFYQYSPGNTILIYMQIA